MTAIALTSWLALHIGVGAGVIHTPAQSWPWPSPSQPDGFADSLEVELESERFFAASTVLFSDIRGSSQPVSASLRGGIYLAPWLVAPYVAVGAGWLHQLLEDGDGPPNAFEVDGVAALAEVGLMASPRWAFGRVNAYAQIQQPLFGSPSDPYHTPPETKLAYLAGVRLFY